MKINYVKGDATRPLGEGNKIIIHCCNDVGGWGAGFVLALSKRWKEPEREYRNWYDTRYWANLPFRLGEVQVVKVEDDIWVGNIIGQHNTWTSEDGVPPIRYSAIEKALQTIRTYCKASSGWSIHCPKFGAGLAGGDWKKIEQLLNINLVNHGIPVTVYEL